MKLLITILIVIITNTVFSQEIITKDVGDFSELKVYDLMVVTLIQSNENKVVIKGENTQNVSIVNKNGKLKVKMETDKIFQGEETYVEVYFTNISILDANEGAQIVGNEMITQNMIELRSQEGGRIKVGLDVSYSKIKAVSGGIIEASGLSKIQEITINSGGIFEGKDFKTQTTNIAITAAGEADIYATEKVDVKVTAGGDVTIFGNPKIVNEKTLAGGRITRIK